MKPAARPVPALPMALKTGAGLGLFGLALLLAGLAVSRWAGLSAAYVVFGAAAIAVPALLLAAVALLKGVLEYRRAVEHGRALEYRRDSRHLGPARESSPTSFGNTP